MLALLAAICFLLALLKVDININLVTLGLLFFALHFVYPWAPWTRRGTPAA
jgi:hypothetical protein